MFTEIYPEDRQSKLNPHEKFIWWVQCTYSLGRSFTGTLKCLKLFRLSKDYKPGEFNIFVDVLLWKD